jgi:hypothetical protein
MGKNHRARKTPEQYQKAADLIGAGEPISKALTEAGWSQKTANKGVAAIPEGVMKLLPKNQQALIALGKSTEPEDVRHLVSGRLIQNVTQGKDKGSLSAKILGGRRDLNMWTPDMQLGVIILQTPQSAIDNKAALLKSVEEED